MGESALLRAKIALGLPRLADVGDSMREHPRICSVLPEYMFTMHCIIRASVLLMEHALLRCRQLSSDPVATSMTGYLEKHIREEAHHDDWLLDDLALLGFDPAVVRSRTPASKVAAMVGSQYYWIWHHHPVALLGYIAVMEGNPPTSEQIDALMERTGFPRDAFRTMIRHSVLDPRHREDLDELIDILQLSPEQRGLIGLSALHTIDVGGAALEDVIARHSRVEAVR